MQVLFEIMVQNKQKGDTGVESPPPRSFSGGQFHGKRSIPKILSLSYNSFAKETYHFKEPTNRSHPICIVRKYDSFTETALSPKYCLFHRTLLQKRPIILGNCSIPKTFQIETHFVHIVTGLFCRRSSLY